MRALLGQHGPHPRRGAIVAVVSVAFETCLYRRGLNMFRPFSCLCFSLGVVLVAVPFPARTTLAAELSDPVNEVGFGMLRGAVFEFPGAGRLRFLALGDRFARLSVYRIGRGDDRGCIWTSRALDGNVEEVLAADLDGDGAPDHLVCRTPRRIYAFDLRDEFRDTYESLPNTFQNIAAFTVADVDDDPQHEIVVAADLRIHYVDGASFVREWTSMDDIRAARIRAGDVDGDRRAELVLDTGHVLDARSGRVEWQAPSTFGPQLELLDLDGDGIPEIVAESPGQPLRIWDASGQRELRVH